MAINYQKMIFAQLNIHFGSLKHFNVFKMFYGFNTKHLYGLLIQMTNAKQRTNKAYIK